MDKKTRSFELRFPSKTPTIKFAEPRRRLNPYVLGGMSELSTAEPHKSIEIPKELVQSIYNKGWEDAMVSVSGFTQEER